MEGLVTGVTRLVEPQPELVKPRKRAGGLLRRLRSNAHETYAADRGPFSASPSQRKLPLTPASPSLSEPLRAPCMLNTEQITKALKPHHDNKQQHQDDRAPIYSVFARLSSETFSSPQVPRWTPPLSPRHRPARSRAFSEQSQPTAAESVDMLKRPGVPAMADVEDLKRMVGTAARPWVLEFKIRSGR